MPSVSLTNSLKEEYSALFDTCDIHDSKYPAVDKIGNKILKNKDRYESVADKLDMPWFIISVIHNMESSMNFKRHLHNGDPLTKRTTHVPAGRPKTGNPPFTWEQSAEDALRMKRFDKWTDWTVSGILYQLERYNGWGYRLYHKHVLSPYLWSYCNHYTSGKYVADGRWSDTAVSKQCGAAVILRRLAENGEIDFLFAGDGEQALEVLRANPDVEVVLSDINMPRMDGLRLLERLGELERDLKTVIVSAYGDMRNIRTAMNRGAFDFVTKPIEFEDLETTLAKTLEQLQLIRQLRESRDEAERARTTLSRYFSPNVVEALARDPNYLEASGEWRDATFLFTDLANFTPLVESSASDVVVRILKDYLDDVTETIFTHSGTVMKIIGDAVQAIFGAPVDDPDHAAHAVECALAIDAFAEEFRVKLRQEGIDLGVTRIGVNTGHAIIGNFGGKRFFDYTAYGDAVNIAARLEQANKVIGTRICVSESVAENVPGFRGRPIGTLLLKGKTEAVRCFEPLREEQATDAANSAYLDAYALLEAGDPKAKQAFAAVMGQYDDDALTAYHLGRLLGGETGIEIELDR